MRRVRPDWPSARVRRLGGAAALLALLLLAWLALRETHRLPPEPAAATSAEPQMLASTSPASAGTSMPSSTPAPRVGAQAHIADDARCVIKEQPPAPAGAEASSPPPAADPQVQASRARLLARLGASPDPYANAVAVWLDVPDDADDQRLAERQRKLAAMAASTQDPNLYSLALRSCWGYRKHPCEPGLSARRWSEIEPANALPWLMMFDEAAQNSDLSGMHEAMFRATQARRFAERADAPLKPIVDVAGADPESLVAARALAIEATGISAALVGTSGTRACNRVTPANANAWQECLALADLMAQHSDSLMQRSLGQGLRQRLTGEPRPAEQTAATDRMVRAQAALFASSGCGDLRNKLALLRRMAVDGEVAVAQDLAR